MSLIMTMITVVFGYDISIVQHLYFVAAAFDGYCFGAVLIINEMENKYRDALALKYLYGHNISGIAKLLGITDKNAEMRIYRSKAILKARLEENGSMPLS